MSKAPTRALRVFRYAVYFDGVDDYAVISPFTVYGWSEITIIDYLYFYHPKPLTVLSKHSMIGDPWVTYPTTMFATDSPTAYTTLAVRWDARRPDGTKLIYLYSLMPYVNQWIHVVRRFTSRREISFYVNAEKKLSATVPAGHVTVLEQNPDTASNPLDYKRFTLGANVRFGEWLRIMQYQLLIYSRALTDSEISWNYSNPDNPVKNGLVLWLQAHPDNIKDVDGDGRLEWVDLSGFGNHGKIYGATLVEVVKSPVRVLSPARVVSTV